jgi:hypothetical protein
MACQDFFLWKQLHHVSSNGSKGGFLGKGAWHLITTAESTYKIA